MPARSRPYISVPTRYKHRKHRLGRDRPCLDPVKRALELIERHYGGLQGKNKAEAAEKFGDEQVRIWRRYYDTRPPETFNCDGHHPDPDHHYKNAGIEVQRIGVPERCREARFSVLGVGNHPRPQGWGNRSSGGTRQLFESVDDKARGY
jgi:hypothetical protein